MLQCHGVLMAVVFVVVLPVSVVIAATFRKAQGSNLWFQVHRMIGVSISCPGTQMIVSDQRVTSELAMLGAPYQFIMSRLWTCSLLVTFMLKPRPENAFSACHVLISFRQSG